MGTKKSGGVRNNYIYFIVYKNLDLELHRLCKNKKELKNELMDLSTMDVKIENIYIISEEITDWKIDLYFKKEKLNEKS